jgi:divalent metal cation (Fe/Co/Zn/Cd) transporter
MPDESTRTVLVATGADLRVALAKVFAGSTAVAAATADSLADTANDVFLLLAQRRSSRRADGHHALGYGREAYFWALLAGLGVFVGGAVFSLREGIDELIHPGVTSSFAVAYVVLAISAGFDLVSFRQSAGQMTRRARRFHRQLAAESAPTSDPTLWTVFVSDLVAIGADLITLAALALTRSPGRPRLRQWPPCSSGWRLSGIGLRLVRRSHDFVVGAWVTAAWEPQNLDIGTFTQPLQPAWGERARAFLLGYPV